MVGMFSKPKKPNSPWDVNKPINTDLQAMPGVQVQGLPGIPQPPPMASTMTAPQAEMPAGIDNNQMGKLLQMLKMFQGQSA
jgi:hypothetical protein